MLDCFVLPSQAEGTSCTLQEAMASGLPVVATAVGGTPQLVTHGVNGMLVPPEDEQGIADAVASFFTSPETSARMGRHARETAQTRFGLNGMVTRYAQLFERGAKASESDMGVM
jgi:glycosyltransferase involved in cell wall biosynthesis